MIALVVVICKDVFSTTNSTSYFVANDHLMLLLIEVFSLDDNYSD